MGPVFKHMNILSAPLPQTENPLTVELHDFYKDYLKHYIDS